MAFPDLSLVFLTRAVPEHGLAAGALGTVVGVYRPGDPTSGYEVEFVDNDGRTIAVVTLTGEDLEPA